MWRQNTSKRPKIERSDSNSESWDTIATTFREMSSDLNSGTITDPFTESTADASLTHIENNANLSSNVSKSDVIILYTSVKKVGSKLRGLALHKKITQMGEPLADNQVFKARTAYWFAVDYPCSLTTKALGNSNKQKERLDLAIKERLTFENGATLFHIYVPKQAGLHQLTFFEATRITTKMIRVITDSQTEFADPDQALMEAEQYNQLSSEYIRHTTQFGINAIIISFNDTQLRSLHEALRQLDFIQENESLNFQLWRRHTTRTTSMLIYKNFNAELILACRDNMTLADGVLALLPRQNERNYQISAIDDTSLVYITTVGPAETTKEADLPPDVQLVIQASTKDREHCKSFAISAVHDGGVDSAAFLRQFLQLWLATKLTPKTTPRPNLALCFRFEEDIRQLENAANQEVALEFLNTAGV